MIAGLNYNSNGNQWAESNAILNADMNRFSTDGLNILSVRIMMSVMAPSNPTTLSATALANLIRVLNAADNYGVKVHLDFWTQNGSTLGKPSWVSSYDTLFSTDRTDYINYMQTVTNAVKFHPAIEAYSVLNEPYFYGALTKSSAQTAFPLFYNAVKSQDPARIVSCRFTLSYTPGSGKYDASVYSMFDVYEITEYLNPLNPGDSRYNSVWSYWDKTIIDLNALGKHFWVIEYGVSSDWASDAEAANRYRASLLKFEATGIVDRVYAWTYTNWMGEKFNLKTAGGVKPAYNELLLLPPPPPPPHSNIPHVNIPHSNLPSPPPEGIYSLFMKVTDPDITVGQHPAVTLTDDMTETVYQQLLIPANFTSLGTVKVFMIAGSSGNMVASVDTNWGKICNNEVYNHNTDSIPLSLYPVLINDITCIDITDAFTGVVAGDLVGVAFTRQGGHVNDSVNWNCYYLGLELTYN